MKVLNREKVFHEFGSITALAKTTPFDIKIIHQLSGLKPKKFFRSDKAQVFEAYKHLDERGYMVDYEESK